MTQNDDDVAYNNYIFSNFFDKEQLLVELLDLKLTNHQQLKDFLSPYQKYKLNVEIEQNFKHQSRIYRALLGLKKRFIIA